MGANRRLAPALVSRAGADDGAVTRGGEDDGDAAAFSGYNKGGGRRRRRGCPSSGLTIVVWSEPVIFGRRHLRYFSTDSHELQFVPGTMIMMATLARQAPRRPGRAAKQAPPLRPPA